MPARPRPPPVRPAVEQAGERDRGTLGLHRSRALQPRLPQRVRPTTRRVPQEIPRVDDAATRRSWRGASEAGRQRSRRQHCPPRRRLSGVTRYCPACRSCSARRPSPSARILAEIPAVRCSLAVSRLDCPPSHATRRGRGTPPPGCPRPPIGPLLPARSITALHIRVQPVLIVRRPEAVAYLSDTDRTRRLAHQLAVPPQIGDLQERLAVGVPLGEREMLGVQLDHLRGDLRHERLDRLAAEHIGRLHEHVLGQQSRGVRARS